MGGSAPRSPAAMPDSSAGILRLELRCKEHLCVLGLTLSGDRELVRAQELLFPDAPLNAWRSALETMTAKVMSGL